MARPITDQQWQDAVDAAHAIMTMETGRIFGLLKGMPEIDFEACFQILEEGRAHGITPMADVLELQNSAAALIEKIDARLSMLHSSDYVGEEIERLRAALKHRREKEVYFYANRRVS